MCDGDLTPPSRAASVPWRVGSSDVRRVEDLTSALRALDYQYGGGSCREAVLALVAWARQLLAADGTDTVQDRLCVAVADLHNLAGWTAFDTGLVGSARSHFEHAMELAKTGHDDELAANVLYRMGRVHLHHEAPREALTLFQLGQAAARSAGSALAVSILCANEAWAYAKFGAATPALEQLGRAEDEFAKADLAQAPPWAKFFDEADLSAMIGTVRTELAQTSDLRHTRSAIPALTEALARYGDDNARSRSFTLVMLSLNHMLEGDIDQAGEVGAEAVALCEGVRSTRTKDRMRPLKREADKRRRHAGAADLSERMSAFFSTARDVA